MPHLSLYRKYRPQTFDDVVGQDHITRTLRNAVEEGAVAHAYLFCGPRGTGKTTTARILAKALNCAKGPTPDPDDTCESCLEITEGRHPDVYELDAASRTQVDNVRLEIIDRVMYAPVRGPWKVYVIDEVHMLSNHSFNALLKTIEEPPGKVLFILCTTHPHKVPETIHSRCQRFDFRRISVDDIVGRLARIAGQESIAVEEGALPLIARHALGGMRDAIGTLDQLASFTGRNIALDDVEGLLGEVDSARLAHLADLVADRDVAGCFRFVAALAEEGTDIPEFVRGFTRHVRDLFVVSAAGEAPEAVDATAVEVARLGAQAVRFDADRLARMLDLLGELAGEMRWSPDPRLALEVCLTRMARPVSDLTLEAVAERVVALEAGAPATVVHASAPVPPARPARAKLTPAAGAEKPEHVQAEAPVVARAVEAVPAAETRPPDAASETEPPAPARPPAAGIPDVATMRRAWRDVLRAMKAQRPMAANALLDTEVDIDGDVLVVEFAPNRRTPMKAASEQDAVALLRDCVRRVTGATMAVRFQTGRGAVRHDDPAGDIPDVPDATDGDAPPSGFAGPADTGTDGTEPSAATDAARVLIDGLGAEVMEDPKTTTPGKKG